MHRSIRVALLATLVVVFPLVAACGAASTTALTTPSSSAKGQQAPVVSNAGGPSVNQSECVRGSQNEPLVTFDLKMTSATAGWALGQCTLASLPSFPNGSTLQCYWPPSQFAGILRTTDGGATWTDVSPPSVANRSFQHAEFFQDAEHAWVGEVSRTADACVSAITTFMTSDGGNTWQLGGTVAIKSESPTSGVFDVPGPTHAMDFIDALHGWMLVSATAANPQPGAMVDPTVLYSTADGGLNWRLVATNPGKATETSASGCQSSTYAPASDAVFATATSGWLAIHCSPAIAILRTDDGGSTWAVTPLPCTCMVWQPEYLDAMHAVITGTQGSPVLVATGDGGASWAQRAAPTAASTFFSFVDPNNGWMVGIEQLPKSYDTVVYRTTDGGQSWQPVAKPGFATATSGPNLYYPIEYVQFVDADHGFVVLGPEAGNQGTPSVAGPQLQIVATADGGRTWSTVLKQVPTVSCTNNYTQLGPGNGNQLLPAKMASPAIGWAQGGLRTTDGGLHWRDLSPPALRAGSASPLYPAGYTDFYLDGNHAWQAAVYGSKTSCFDHVSTFATADGGRTWQQSTPIVLNLPAGYQTSAIQIGFTSAQEGWLWVPTGAHTNDPFGFSPSQADLYTTGDGGQTWRHTAGLSNSQLHGLPVPSGSQGCTPSFGQQIEFSSSSVGWLNVYCAESPMLETRDGGLTWRVPSFPIPSSTGCPCYIAPPTFADAMHGMLVVSGQNGLAGSTLLLATSDGGVTWRTPQRPGTGYVLLLDFLNSTDLFALVTPPGWTKFSNAGFELYRSLDDGGSWTLVQAKVPASWPPGFMQFVDLKCGFESNVNGATELLTTCDGGASWKSITPAVSS
jgi:photosystem II stability/assembly factor-like uncharacterized protein